MISVRKLVVVNRVLPYTIRKLFYVISVQCEVNSIIRVVIIVKIPVAAC